MGTTRPLDRLSPESRAVLSLILLQSRSYADIAALLHLDEHDVRERAHAAARHLVTSDERPDRDVQARIIDFVLGEQVVSERAETRSLLEGDGVARAWAVQLVDGLAPLATGTLPEIPSDEAVQPELPERATPPVVIAPVVTPAPAPARSVITTPERLFEPAPHRSGPPVRVLVPALGLLVVAVVVVIVAVSAGGGGSSSAPTSSKEVVTRQTLSGTSADPGAGGSATVERQGGGLLLQIRGNGLAANTRSNSYAVWLYNSQSEALLLGFVSPPVSSSGSFANDVTLPADANRFHAVIVTVETVSQPSAPGTIVLRAPLGLR